MAGKLHHSGQQKMATEGIINETLYIGLYSNPVELTRDKLLTDIVEVEGFTGYERKVLALLEWIMGTTDHTTYYAYEEQVWTLTFTPTTDITGYFITNGSILLATEHFGLPVVPDRPGFELKVTPVMVVR
jgi:hypothetical protein